jgi:hypothetical protein
MMTEDQFREGLKSQLRAVRFKTIRKQLPPLCEGLGPLEARELRIVLAGSSLPFAEVYLLSVNHAPDEGEGRFEKLRDRKTASSRAAVLRKAASVLREVWLVEIPWDDPKGVELTRGPWHSLLPPSVRARLPEAPGDLEEVAASVENVPALFVRPKNAPLNTRKQHFREEWAKLVGPRPARSLDKIGAAAFNVTFGESQSVETFKRLRLALKMRK